MKYFHKTYRKIFGKNKAGGDAKEAAKRRSYKKVSNFSTQGMKQSRDEKITWKGLEERNFRDMGFDDGAFKPEDLLMKNDPEDKMYLQEYEIELDTGNPTKHSQYGNIVDKYSQKHYLGACKLSQIQLKYVARGQT